MTVAHPGESAADGPQEPPLRGRTHAHQRLKSYGASVELLALYPASRDDETNLHRQLTPARARGREWYEDGPIIQLFIDKALEQFGMPPSFDGLWTEPKRIVAGKRHR